MVLNVLYREEKYIGHAFILLCAELIQSCLVIISPTQNALVEAREKLMYNITASLFLGLDNI